jgi:hypothetical protein
MIVVVQTFGFLFPCLTIVELDLQEGGGKCAEDTSTYT